MSAAITAAVVAAGATAYAANKNAKAAKAAGKGGGSTDQTTTTTPWNADLIGGDINNILDMQRRLAAGGPAQIGGNGQLAPAAPAGPAVPPGGTRRPDGRILDASGRTIYTPPAAAAPRAGKGGGGGGAAAKPTAPAGGIPAPAAGGRLTTPDSIFTEVANRGLAAGNTATQTQARNGIANILGAAGQPGGSAGAGERTGFEAYNPVLDALTTQLQGRTANDPNALLLQFLGENGRGGAAGSQGAGGQGEYDPYANPGQRGGVPKSQLWTGNPTGSSGGWGGQGGSGAGAGGGNGGSLVPDASGNGLFGTEVRKIFDEQANETEISNLIRLMNEDVEKGMFRDLAQLSAAAQGAGRFGGGMWKGVSNDAREEALQEMAKASSGVRLQDADSRRAARLAALGQVNTRDLGAMNDATQREGIRASSSAAASSSADQMALAQRGQDLQALGMLLNQDQFGLGTLGSIGQQLSSDRLASIGLTPEIEGIGLQGLNLALGGGGGLTDLRGQDVQRHIANQQANISRIGLNQQASMWNAQQGQQQVNDYLRTIAAIGGMGGTSHTTGTNVQSIPGVDPTASALLGGLGAGLSAYGAFGGGGFGGGFGGGARPVYSDGQGVTGRAVPGAPYMGGL